MITFASCVWITKKETQTQMKSNETKVKTTKEQNKQLKLKRKKKKTHIQEAKKSWLKNNPKVHLYYMVTYDPYFSPGDLSPQSSMIRVELRSWVKTTVPIRANGRDRRGPCSGQWSPTSSEPACWPAGWDHETHERKSIHVMQEDASRSHETRGTRVHRLMM